MAPYYSQHLKYLVSTLFIRNRTIFSTALNIFTLKECIRRSYNTYVVKHTAYLIPKYYSVLELKRKACIDQGTRAANPTSVGSFVHYYSQKHHVL